jgi:hypothetical protein
MNMAPHRRVVFLVLLSPNALKHAQSLVQRDKALPISRSLRISIAREQGLPLFVNQYILPYVQPTHPVQYKYLISNQESLSTSQNYI